MGYGITFRVSGKRACFTRPELKAERVSYDVMTPSAARGVIEAIYWKPAIAWRIDSIEVLSPIRFDTIRRNEVGKKISYSNARRTMNQGKPFSEIASEDRQQRLTMFLRDVDYIVKAHFELTDHASPEDTREKHYNIVLRRLRKGQCFHQPYLGCREFPAEVRLVEGGCPHPGAYASVPEKDLGFMLYDIDFANDMSPMFFRAVMHNGVIDTRMGNAVIAR
jgi:CRISPR-associated protein Cas5d